MDGRFDRNDEAERRARKIERMSEILLLSDIDLGDERAAIRLLQANGELASDIVTYLDAAIERARTRMQTGEAA